MTTPPDTPTAASPSDAGLGQRSLAPADYERQMRDLSAQRQRLEAQNEALRHAQSALARSRDRYRDLYDHAPVGFVTIDAQEGRVVESNGLAASLLGQASPQLLGQTFSDFISADDQPHFSRHLAQVLGRSDVGTLEVRLTTIPGAPLNAPLGPWVALKMAMAATLADDDNEDDDPALCRIALIDISERVRMQEGASRLAAIVSSSDDAIVSRDLDGRVTAWNDGARRLFGYSAAEMLGQTMQALVPPDRREQEADCLRRIAHGEKVAHLESERLCHNGMALPVSMSLSPIRVEQGADGGPVDGALKGAARGVTRGATRGAIVGSAMIARDITERRRNDRALRERLRQLDVLSQSSQALILGEQDPLAMRRELFARLREAVGCEICFDCVLADGGKSMMLASDHGLSDDLRAQLARQALTDSLCGLVVQRGARLVVERLQQSELPQARLLKAAGATCYAGYPLLAHGHIYGVAVFVSTSRERFRGGDLLVMSTLCDQMAAMLERHELVADLRGTEQTLRRADKAKDELIATLAHELRNPLAPIRNAISILRRADLTDTRQTAWCRDIIDRQVVQMTHLLEDLLDASRLTRRKIELRQERLDLRRAVEQAVEATQHLIDGQAHRLTLDLPAEPVIVHGDLTRLTQVFANLLNNACKYSDRGSSIALRLQCRDEVACVSVRDNGIGIAPEQMQQVFQMFSQLAPALERSSGGLGIGLALARGLVELHGGSIDARSEGVGHGTEFTVRLPMGQAGANAPLWNGQSDVGELAPHRLLVVDDNVDAAQTLAAMLSLHGQQVRTAFGSVEALQVAEEWRPDVAVLDIGMPGLNGYELCRRLREQSHGRPPLFVACTGWGQDADRERAYAAGFDFHLVKPVEPNALLRLLSVVDANATRH